MDEDKFKLVKTAKAFHGQIVDYHFKEDETLCVVRAWVEEELWELPWFIIRAVFKEPTYKGRQTVFETIAAREIITAAIEAQEMDGT